VVVIVMVFSAQSFDVFGSLNQTTCTEREGRALQPRV
jgi:hypothetical protein